MKATRNYIGIYRFDAAKYFRYFEVVFTSFTKK